MQRRDKVKVQELIGYWHYRANALRDSRTDLTLCHARADDFDGCARQLKRLLAGKPTDADGFKLKTGG